MMNIESNRFRVFLVVILLTIILAESMRAYSQKHDRHQAPSPQRSDATRKNSAPEKEDRQPPSRPQHNSSDDEGQQNSERAVTAMRAREKLISAANGIESVEYRILAQTEVGALLWRQDKPRARLLIGQAIDALRNLLNEKGKESKTGSVARLRLAVIKRLARLDSDLIKELDSIKEDQKPTEWTEESQVLMKSAQDEIERNPKQAVLFAKKSFAFGQPAGLGYFLYLLSNKDNALAEEAVPMLLTLLRDSESSPNYFTEIGTFLFSPQDGKNFSDRARNFFWEALALRLRRTISFSQSIERLGDSFELIRYAIRLSKPYPAWQAKFVAMKEEMENIFHARSAPPPPSPDRVTIDMSATMPAKAGDTSEVRTSLLSVAAIPDVKKRDERYSALAVQAARLNDSSLAEDILSKVSDQQLRKHATVSVYGPLMRKAANDLDWTSAKMFLFKVADPIGCSLMANEMSQAMLQAKVEKSEILEFHTQVAAQLRQEKSEIVTGIGALLLARNALKMDEETGFKVIGVAIEILNSVEISSPYAELHRNVSPWLGGLHTSSNSSGRPVVDITEIVISLFEEAGKRNQSRAESLALTLSHGGLNTLAQLGALKTTFEEPTIPKKLLKENRNKE